MKDYLEYDEYGLKEVRCMVCNTVVANRTYIDVADKQELGKTVKVMTMQRLSSWKQPKKVEVEIDGINSFVEPIMCSDCINEDLDTDEVMDQIVNGWGLELKHLKNWSDVDIDKYKLKKKPKKKP